MELIFPVMCTTLEVIVIMNILTLYFMYYNRISTYTRVKVCYANLNSDINYPQLETIKGQIIFTLYY